MRSATFKFFTKESKKINRWYDAKSGKLLTVCESMWKVYKRLMYHSFNIFVGTKNSQNTKLGKTEPSKINKKSTID